MSKVNESAGSRVGLTLDSGSKGPNNIQNRSPLVKACLNQQKNQQQQLYSSSSLTRLQKNNPLFGEVLSGVSMVVHEPYQVVIKENFKPLNPKRSLIKRRDEMHKDSATYLESESDEIAPWGGLAHGSQKSTGT